MSRCEVDGCERDQWCDWLCQAHYMRKYRTGKVGNAEIAPQKRVGCAVEGCNGQHRAKEYCQMHYRRFCDNGDPLIVRQAKGLHVTCTVDGCNKPHHSKGYCKPHYNSRRTKDADYIPQWSQHHASTIKPAHKDR